MNKLNLESELSMDAEKHNELVQFCKSSLARISELGPSDNDLKLSLQKHGQEFLATVRMVSLGLMFDLQARACSPFMAVESAMKEALVKIKKWSALR